MKVSVLVITHNQAAFITQAIDSVLTQEVNFEYEAVVGEDASTDRTREILIALQKAHPNKIRLLLHEEKLEGIPSKLNLVKTLAACKGEYVAWLDGDDYWTDPHKLQKQVDFLESHPECAICFHNVVALGDDGSTEPGTVCPPDQKEISTLEDLLSGNPMPSCSVLFRRGLFDQFPDWYFTLAMSDWPLHILNAQHGKIGYINEVMATYRVHTGGIWSSKRPSRQLLNMIELLDRVDEHLNFSYKDTIRATKARYYYQLAVIYRDRGHLPQARRVLRQSIRCWGFGPRRAFGLLFPREVSILGRFATLRGFFRRVSSQSKPVSS